MITLWFKLVIWLVAFYLGAFAGYSITGEDLGVWVGGVLGLVFAVLILYALGV